MDEAIALEPEQWVDRHADSLYRFALMRIRDPERAADLVQDTLLDAFRAQAGFRGNASERTWLVSILKHKILDDYRKRSKRTWQAQTSELEDDSAEPDIQFTETGRWVDPPSAWPDDALERSEFWDTLYGCLSGLPTNHSRPFVMREVDGMEADEVCKLCDITPTNLWVRLHRARLALRGCLQSRWLSGSEA